MAGKVCLVILALMAAATLLDFCAAYPSHDNEVIVMALQIRVPWKWAVIKSFILLPKLYPENRGSSRNGDDDDRLLISHDRQHNADNDRHRIDGLRHRDRDHRHSEEHNDSYEKEYRIGSSRNRDRHETRRRDQIDTRMDKQGDYNGRRSCTM